MQAGRRLVERLWPRIRERVPGARLLIVGRRAGRAMRRYVGRVPGLEVRSDVADPIPQFREIDVMLYALSNSKMMAIGKQHGLRVAGEVFADRGYADDGTLAPRGSPGAMIEDAAVAARRALNLVKHGSVKSLSGKTVAVSADTLCLHGDQPGAATFAKALREAFAEQGIAVAAP